MKFIKEKYPLYFLYLIMAALGFQGCHSVDSERIPNMVVNISLSNAGVWNLHGVSGFGSHQYFIYPNIPVGYTYLSGSATGFGGVLLIEGMDPVNNLGAYPLAYDLACPVERNPDIRVKVSPDDYVAYCEECGSTYDVTMGGGGALAGEAAKGKYRYGLKVYRVVPSSFGGYNIIN